MEGSWLNGRKLDTEHTQESPWLCKSIILGKPDTLVIDHKALQLQSRYYCQLMNYLPCIQLLHNMSLTSRQHLSGHYPSTNSPIHPPLILPPIHTHLPTHPSIDPPINPNNHLPIHPCSYFCFLFVCINLHDIFGCEWSYGVYGFKGVNAIYTTLVRF